MSAAERFAGADFDGMVDLKTSSWHWLEPDGTATVAKAGGGGSTLPEVIGDPPSPNSQLVSFGADFVPVHRRYSDDFRASLEAEITEAAGDGQPYDPNRSYDVAVIDGRAVPCTGQHPGDCYGSTLVYRLAEGRAA